MASVPALTEPIEPDCPLACGEDGARYNLKPSMPFNERPLAELAELATPSGLLACAEKLRSLPLNSPKLLNLVEIITFVGGDTVEASLATVTQAVRGSEGLIHGLIDCFLRIDDAPSFWTIDLDPPRRALAVALLAGIRHIPPPASDHQARSPPVIVQERLTDLVIHLFAIRRGWAQQPRAVLQVLALLRDRGFGQGTWEASDYCRLAGVPDGLALVLGLYSDNHVAQVHPIKVNMMLHMFCTKARVLDPIHVANAGQLLLQYHLARDFCDAAAKRSRRIEDKSLPTGTWSKGAYLDMSAILHVLAAAPSKLVLDRSLVDSNTVAVARACVSSIGPRPDCEGYRWVERAVTLVNRWLDDPTSSHFPLLVLQSGLVELVLSLHSIEFDCLDDAQLACTSSLVLRLKRAAERDESIRRPLRDRFAPSSSVLLWRIQLETWAERSSSPCKNQFASRVTRAWLNLATTLGVEVPPKGVKTCTSPVCRRTSETGATMSVCRGCGLVFYCSRACQTSDWKDGHNKRCKLLQQTPPPSKPPS